MRRGKIPGILFIADLPSECKKSDILEILLDYGPIDDIELVKIEDVLHFARVSFRYVVDAMSAVDELQSGEESILGEPLKISWASPCDVVPLYNPATPTVSSYLSAEDLKPPSVHVLFSFISCQVIEQISEQIIAESFFPFGILTDVNIKKHNTVGNGGYQNGFGFVEYEHNWGGILSAIRAVRWFDKKYMGHMTLDAKFGQQFQHFLLKHGILTEEELLALKSINPIQLTSDIPKKAYQHHDSQPTPRMASIDNLFSLSNARKSTSAQENNDGKYISDVFGNNKQSMRGGRGRGDRYEFNQSMHGNNNHRSSKNRYFNNHVSNHRSQWNVDHHLSSHNHNHTYNHESSAFPPESSTFEVIKATDDILPGDSLLMEEPKPSTNVTNFVVRTIGDYDGGGWVDDGES